MRELDAKALYGDQHPEGALRAGTADFGMALEPGRKLNGNQGSQSMDNSISIAWTYPKAIEI